MKIFSGHKSRRMRGRQTQQCEKAMLPLVDARTHALKVLLLAAPRSAHWEWPERKIRHSIAHGILNPQDVEIWQDSLVRHILVLDTAVDEASDLARRLPDSSGVGGDGELLEELVEHLDGLSVLGRHLVEGWKGSEGFEKKSSTLKDRLVRLNV